MMAVDSVGVMGRKINYLRTVDKCGFIVFTLESRSLEDLLMSWQTAGILFCLWLIVLWLVLECLSVATRGDRDDWEDAYQWKLRRKIERDGKRQQWGWR